MITRTITVNTSMSTEHMVPLELSPPDISAYRQGNTGVEYVTTFDSGVAGPHVMVNAVTHGNEICGALAVDRLFRMGVRPVRGKLTLAFANVAAFANWDPAKPHASRFVDEDFNRVWSAAVLDGPRDSVELRRARAMRPIIDSVDLLLDIHSMHDPHGPVMLSGPNAKGIQLAREVGIPVDIVSDHGHANGTRMRDYAGFGEAASAKNALLVECGQHWAYEAERVAWQSTWRFLKVCGVVDPALADAELDPEPLPPARVVRITDALVAKSIDYKFAPGLAGLSVVPKAGDLIATDSGEPVLAPYDNCVLIMPTMVHVKPGLTVVRIGQIVPA